MELKSQVQAVQECSRFELPELVRVFFAIPVISSPVPSLYPFRLCLRAAGGAQNADIEQTENVIPLITG